MFYLMLRLFTDNNVKILIGKDKNENYMQFT